jgi:paraquat-inducible protein B
MVSDSNPSIRATGGFSTIWVIPIVALVIGLWMVVQTKLSEGPDISISFATAEGLEVGKTKVKYLSVEVGLVEDIILRPDKEGVIAKVKLDREAIDLLRHDTQFWVVRARVGAGSITGIGTILSGAYIELAPGEKVKGGRNYTGLEQPPVTPLGAPGVRLSLFSTRGGSVGTGDAVLYNGYKVGRVESEAFDPERVEVRYDIFIDAPFDSLVTTSVRFWNVSGISVNASAGGVEVSTGSLDTIILGGLAFEVPDGVHPGLKVGNDAQFDLYESRADMQDQPFRKRVDYVVAFGESLRGLSVGAPVEYKGILMGRVKRILVKEIMNRKDEYNIPIPVLVSLEPGRLEMGDDTDAIENLREAIAAGVEFGLRGSLETGSLLTGGLYVKLDYYEDAEPAELGQFEGYETIPTIATGLGRIEQQISTLLDKVNDLPLASTLQSIDGTLIALTRTLDAAQQILGDDNARQLTVQLNATLRQMRILMESFSPDGAGYETLHGSLIELNKTLDNLESITSTLKHKPNSLVLPMSFPSDPIPEAGK